MPDTALHPEVQVTPDRPSRREPLYSAEYVEGAERRAQERYEAMANRYSLQVATARYAISMALAALGHGDVDRAVRELRRGGVCGVEEVGP